MFRSFQFRDYRFLWLTIALTNAGMWAFTLTMGWKIDNLTSSSFWVGAGVFLIFIPNIMGGPLAGVLSDRLERRKIILAAAAAGLLLSIGLFIISNTALGNELYPYLLASFIFGIMTSVLNVSLNSLLPVLIPAESLYNAVSLQGLAMRGTEFVGPVVASPLLIHHGPRMVFMVNGLLYAAAMLMVSRLRMNNKVDTRISKGFVQPLIEGFRYIRRIPGLGLLLLVVALHCSLTMAYMGMLPDFAKTFLHTKEMYGRLMIFVGLGAIAGSLTLAAINGQRTRSILFWVTAAVSGLSLVLLGTLANNAAAEVTALLVGSSQGMFMTLSLATIQSSVEDYVRGRVTSAYLFVAGGIMSIANWLYGLLGSWIPTHAILIGIGSSFFVLSLLFYFLSGTLKTLFPDVLLHRVKPPTSVGGL